MRMHVYLPILAAVAAAALAFGVTRQVACRGDASMTDRLSDVAFLTRELQLNPEQAEQLRGLHGALGKRLDDCCARHCQARAGMADVLTGDAADSARTEAYLAEMARVYAESEQATLAHIRQVRAVLNDAQRARFDAMLTRCMCQACPAAKP